MKPASILATLLSVLPAILAGAGKELEGERAAARSECPTPEEARAKMTVPEGYEVRCFAHEPMVQNPVAMTWDHRGRLWVVEAYEYPLGTPLPVDQRPFGGEAKDSEYQKVPAACGGNSQTTDNKTQIPKDRVIILEDMDNDGVADKRTVFVQGLNLASAILCGDGGIYVGQQPHLIHFKDTDGDDHADEWRVALTGFGREDTHELMNSFCWGPDGWLYMTHGVFTNSKVRRPGEPVEKGFKFDAGIGRCKPLTGEFEVFADGTSNPWGCDYDARGNFFVSACVIDHFFHMAPGGIYVRQGGAPENPYAYEMLPSIVTHKHFRAAYAGVQIYQGARYPEDTWGHAFIGNIHDNAIHEEVITPVGASFKCEPRRDFLRANDGWFRPVSTQTGPDGFLWVMDWCDKYPCYQNAKANPEGVDRERGRIWRIVHDEHGARTSVRTDADSKRTEVRAPVSASRESKDMDMKKLGTPELVKLLEHPNNWMRRMARRMLVERKDFESTGLLQDVISDPSKSESVALENLWTALQLHEFHFKGERGNGVDISSWAPSIPTTNAGLLQWSARALQGSKIFLPFSKSVPDKSFEERIWNNSRSNGNPADPEHIYNSYQRVEWLAQSSDPVVLHALAVALRTSYGQALTRTVAPSQGPESWIENHSDACLSVALPGLLRSAAKVDDQTLHFAIWQAIEPRLAANPGKWAPRLASVVASDSAMCRSVAHKSMRRLCDTRDAKNLDFAIAFCEKIQDHDALLAHALDGLVKGQESGVLRPTVEVTKALATWRASDNAEVRKQARSLAVLWGDEAAIKELLALVGATSGKEQTKIEALQTLRRVKSGAVREGLAELLDDAGSQTPPVLIEAIRAAAELGGDGVLPGLLKLASTKDFGIQQAALSALAGRTDWTHAMLEAIAEGKLTAVGFPISVRRSLATSADKSVRDHAFRVLGAWKEASDDVKALIAAKKKVCLDGEPDLAMGKTLFVTTCATCHTFYGGGQKVGPELIGSGRSNLDALLANVIDPNQIIGNGYEAINVTTKDNRTLSGRMVEDTPSHVKLLGIGGAEQIVPRDQIAKLENTHQSTMPTGFGALPDDAFRSLIWYVLAPPEEGPLTAEKKSRLSASIDAAPAKKASAGSNSRAIDWEGVALWNPEWEVNAPDFERTPMKLPEFHGRKNVLLMHPFSKDKPCSLERTMALEVGKPHKLSVTVASHDQGDWELRVLVNGQEVGKSTVGHVGERWKTVTVDLGKYAGKEVKLRLEGAANGWAYEFGYWGEVKVE